MMKKILLFLVSIFDNNVKQSEYEQIADLKDDIDWMRILPYILLHLSAFAVFFVGVSTTALIVFLITVYLRIFTLTAFYHRYFSHRTFKTSRVVQFIFAVIGTSAVQRGPLWWAAHHRHHHVASDSKDDTHSPITSSFLWSHTGWFLSKKNFMTKLHLIKDFSAFPELRLLDRFDLVVPFLYAISMYFLGEYIALVSPESNTSGWQLFIWGFVLSTLMVYHSTFLVNSVAHLWGSRRYKTKDRSRNNIIIALLTFGEGWHNNHHHYPASTGQGFFWWEIDISLYILRFMSLFGLVWDIQTVPKKIRDDVTALEKS